MNKVRVYEVARDLGLDNRELIMRLASLGIQVKNHMSALEQPDVDRLKRSMEKEKATVEERIRPTVVRRRAAAKTDTPETPAAAAPEPTPPAREHVQEDEPKHEAPAARFEAPEEPAFSPPPKPASEPVREEPVAAPAPVAAAAAPVPEVAPAPPAAPPAPTRNSYPPPASERLGHANLPPGVIARGSSFAPSAPPPPANVVSRIIAEHAPRPSFAPPAAGGDHMRRREIGRAALGPTGRQPPAGRGNMKKKMMPPGRKAVPTQITTPSAQKRVIRIEETVQLQTLAGRMSLKATEVLMKLMQLGMTGVNINSNLDADTAKILASEFGYEVENVAKSDDDLVVAARGTFVDESDDRKLRAPVVAVMGHVDHGKTSLLDRIRKANVASGEAGGITQHIGAYRVDTESGPVVFLDTPGHEAFTAMRARGGQAADVVILVVAADDGVMPQTKEAIAHARAANTPIVVAVNKIDKPEARPEVVRRELATEGLQSEDWGGDVQFVDVSAKSGIGIPELLGAVLLQAEILELFSNAKIPAEGIVLESYLDKGRGPVANVLVKNGTLRTGDIVIAGSAWGKVRAMTDDRGRATAAAGPSTPVEVLGLSEVPAAGDGFFVVTDAKKAQEIAETRVKSRSKSISPSAQAKVGLDQIYQMMQSGQVQDLRLVIKVDVQGSTEAIVKALTDLSTDKVRVDVIHTGVGGITENDVMLASASSAIVIGFNVRPAGNAAATAKSEKVDVRTYSIIYDAVDEVKKAMTGLLSPTFAEKHMGRAEVRQVFTIPKAGTVAGSFVLDGMIKRGAKARLVRDSVQVWEGTIGGLRRFKDDVREVNAGYECGISLEGYNDIKERDVVEVFELEKQVAVL